MLPKLPTIEEAGRLMRARELTPLDLVEHCLARIAQFEDRIHAWVLVDEEGTRTEARRLTEMLSRGEDLGPLHGIPIGIKDIIDVAGWQTKCGSRLRENVPPAEKDATVVANLRKAGAIILGKTVTTEFACFDPPPTRNPWNLDHTPGGSSSGSAAAVAMEMCMAALGTQTGGSIIRPAAYCGVCGFKPSFGRHSMEGIMPLTKNLDHVGPMARCVGDLRLVHEGMLLPEVRAIWPEAEGVGGLESVHFAVEQSYTQEQADPEVWSRFESAVGQLANAGATITRFDFPPEFRVVHVMHRRIMAAEAAEIHRDEFSKEREHYSPHVGQLIEEGIALSQPHYQEALQHQHDFRLNPAILLATIANYRPINALLMPATPSVAPASLSTTGDPKFNSPWSFTGDAAATVPIGADSSGMPIGIQIIETSNVDALVAARACEALIGSIERPPILGNHR